MRKIAVFTGTRADYGLLYWLMREIQQDSSLELQVIVSGMHLSPEFGETWKTIEVDGFPIDAKIEMLVSSDTPIGIAKSVGLGIIGFTDALDRLRPDCLVVLGDRYEALAVAQTAMFMQIPIAHIHGGELTEGAYDDAIRHAITKMSNWHFVAAEQYRNRVIQLGEAPENVIDVGALGLENIRRFDHPDIDTLGSKIGFPLTRAFFVVTYHPVTASEENPENTFYALVSALDSFPEHQIIFTFPNSDNGGRRLITLIEGFVEDNFGRAIAIKSLGSSYLSAAFYADALIGNSSSGIIEAPSLGTPTVNIGVRQKGRLSARSVVHCGTTKESIETAIRTVLDKRFQSEMVNINNPYGDGDSSIRIKSVLQGLGAPNPKKFFNVDFNAE